MPDIIEPFIGPDTTIHLLATLGAAIINNTDEIPEVAEIGDVELAANIVEFNSFGKDFKEKRVGQKDPGTLDLTLNWMPGDTKHQALSTAAVNKTKIFISIVWRDGAGGNARVDFEAFVATIGVATPIEDIVTRKIQLAITGPVTFDDVTDIALNY